jgi:hypothetical protein
MKSLIIGAGEVGKALKEIIQKTHEVIIRDIEPIDIGLGNIEVLHICYPESEQFIEITQKYIQEYKPKITIIHSSIPIGTSDKFGSDVVYSPIRGRHNRINSINGRRMYGLEFDIPRYVKFIFGSKSARMMAKEYFEKCGIECDEYDCNRKSDGEFLKLISNIHMGLEIAWRQEVGRILNHYHISSYLYDRWESTYNDGYKKCGDEHLIRPTMKPDPIGGHCIIPCTEILSKQFPSKIFDFILESNEKSKKEHKV